MPQLNSLGQQISTLDKHRINSFSTTRLPYHVSKGPINVFTFTFPHVPFHEIYYDVADILMVFSMRAQVPHLKLMRR